MRAERGTLEFDRVAFFADAVYAIALTLLGAEIAPPIIDELTSASELWSALGELQGEITMFFVSFAVIGGYWLAHHQFVGTLAAIDGSMARATVVYLAFVAFVPIPSAILGRYPGNTTAVGFYAVTLAIVSGVEVALIAVARSHDLLRERPSRESVRWSVIAGLAPVAVFLLSIPIAFVSPRVAILSWFVTFPVEYLLGRVTPQEAT